MSAGVASDSAPFRGNTNAAHGVGPQDEMNGVNWTDLNFPPLIRVAHLSVSDLTGDARRACRTALITWVFIMFSLLWNVFSMFTLSCAGVHHSGYFLLLSIFNLIVLGTFSAYFVHRGYKGLVLGKAEMVMHFLIAFAILEIVWMVFSGMDDSNLQGWANINAPRVKKSHAHVWWNFTSVIESVLWTSTYLLGLFALFGMFSQYQRVRITGPTGVQDNGL